MPVDMAWDTFGVKNGAESLREMRQLIERNAKRPISEVGCVVLSEPFFFERADWIPVADWKSNIVKGKKYDLSVGVGADIWKAISARIVRPAQLMSPLIESFGGMGKPVLHMPRLGQGGFRSIITDAYGRRCAITGERTMPVLEAAHIRPFSVVKSHEIRNGLLLRSDIHTLFDQGYVTVQPDHRFRVSKSIREEFENGRDYYALDGKEIRLPINPDQHPDQEHLDWHSSVLFKG
ncbi:MAG: HNH endonuclease [Candidatus Baltobacteraceae bacterium]